MSWYYGGGTIPPVLVPTQDAVSNTSGSSQTPSYTHAQGALSNGYAVVLVHWRHFDLSATLGVNGVTYGGVAMTRLRQEFSSTTYCAVFGLALGDSVAGNKTVQCNFGANPSGGSQFGTVTFAGVSQAGGFTVGSDSDFDNKTTITIATLNADEVAVCGSVAQGDVTVTPADTSLWTNTAGSNITSAGEKKQGTGGNITLTVNYGASANVRACAVVLKKV